MRNLVLIGLGLTVIVSMFSCKSNHICPSFESAYILDREIRDQTFSLFDADTLPKEDFIVRKDKNGIIKSVKYRKKRDELLTVKMETIYPQVEPLDTMLLAEQDLTPEEMEQILSEGQRQVNHYNVDQIYYMRHFGQYLPMPEEPGARTLEEEEGEEIPLEQPVQKKRKKWQFWKKKEVEPTDSLSTEFEEDNPFEQFDEEEDQPTENLSKKEQRQLEQQQKREQEELEKAKEPVIIDLEDFERDREQAVPTDDDSNDKRSKSKKPKGEKKIKLGFGKKKKKTTDSVELIDDDEEQDR